ncbi:MAG: pyruvate, phosphate dikinase [Acidimicrobiales bacterium]
MSTPDHAKPFYTFDEPPDVDPSRWPAVLGGKGAGLARMRALGVPVPHGFTVPTAVCNRVLDAGWDGDAADAVRSGIAWLEQATGRKLGSTSDPLVVSVRSGAPVSMPGMMDTVLNAGMTSEVAAALATVTGDARFGADTHRRFVESFASVVIGVDSPTRAATFEAAAGGRSLDALGPGEYGSVVEAWRERLADAGHEIPADPVEQIVAAVQAVFSSWHAARAVAYRKREGIDEHLGTAATVQAMVFGNRGDRSGTGVVFTRDPSTGASGLVGDFLTDAQGEDVVAGTHDPEPIGALTERWPQVGAELATLATTLERELADMVDIEFTVEDGELWLLQARVGKRSPRAALRLAVGMAEDPDFPVDRATAVERVAPLLDDPPTEAAVDPSGGDDVLVIAEGLAASPGRAVGELCVSPDDAVRLSEAGADLILVRHETSPADVHGMAAARGLATTLGGLVSHAAVVARSWGLPAVVGCADIEIVADGIVAGSNRVPIGTVITVDGDGGRLLLGDHPATGAELPEVAVLRGWRAQLSGASAIKSGHQTEGGADDTLASVSDELSDDLVDDDALRTLGLKGMATAESLAGSALATVDAAAAALAALVEAGRVSVAAGDRYLLTADGTARIDELYEVEAVDAGPVIEPHFERFDELNLRFKQVVTDWQMCPPADDPAGDPVLNDHTDDAYDAAVLAALDADVHAGISSILSEVSKGVSRLAVYHRRLSDAMDAIKSGDTQMVASPLRDSYHTVWFELHEELIRLTGRNRADEAAAGRA